MIEVPTYQDYKNVVRDLEDISKKHNELVEMMRVTTEAVGKLQDELQEMPGGYRNSQDIKNLKGRIERIEAGGLSSSRIEQLEECCKNTVSAGKALEGKVDSILHNGLSRSSIKEIVLDTLRSL